MRQSAVVSELTEFLLNLISQLLSVTSPNFVKTNQSASAFVSELPEFLLNLIRQSAFVSSVADPNPDLPDPLIFGPPGSGSITQRYGSGSEFLSNLIRQSAFVSSVADPNPDPRIHMFLGLLDPKSEVWIRILLWIRIRISVKSDQAVGFCQQCCGSESGSTRSICYWASWIRSHKSEVWIRIRISVKSNQTVGFCQQCCGTESGSTAPDPDPSIIKQIRYSKKNHASVL